MAIKHKGGLVVAKLNDKIVGGCFFIWNKEIVDAFILSTDSEYFHLGVNHSIIDFALRYFSRNGFAWFNWQSCKKGSGVYNFKKRWGSHERQYSFLTWRLEEFAKVFEVTVEDVRKIFNWHYIAPFDALNKNLMQGVFNK